ncbi:hypothetical protein [Cryobacterium sp. Y11]|uniref:hypothetical protein n=1 Tax=Cryobacterium sp. Y11 TaxID=2045016 RepID=UPI000CE4DDED|nr:hypothetical protein [Cryobacterium sp. Y11]
MTTSAPLRRVGLALVVAAAGLTLLAGCSLGDSVRDTVNGAVDGAVQDATGGNVSLGGELPADWPAEIPVLDGEVLFASGGVGQSGVSGWVVTVNATSTTPVDDARAQLVEAGFTEVVAGVDVDVVTVANENYGVVVAGNPDGVLYTVTPVPALG